MKLQVTRIEARTSENREIKPPASCLCCMDTGRAANRFLGEFVDIPASGDFLPYICKRFDCAAGERLLASYEKTDQERDVAWGKLADKDPNVPKFMRQREFQANWSTSLPSSACESMHKWAFDEWVETFVKKTRSPQFQTIDIPSTIVFDKFQESVADRNSQILEIKKAIADAELQGINLKNKIAATVKQCGDRDNLLYQSWEFLPSADHTRMFTGIQDLIKPKAAIAVLSEDYYAAIDF